jgi:hypothetical protein
MVTFFRHQIWVIFSQSLCLAKIEAELQAPTLPEKIPPNVRVNANESHDKSGA